MVANTYLRDKAAIVGIGQTEFSRNSGRSELRLAVEAISAALDDCGLTPSDVDGLVKLSGDSSDDTDIMNSLGMQNVRSMAHWGVGGNSPCALVKLAAMMIASGQAEVVVGWRALNERSGHRFGQSSAAGRIPGIFGYYTSIGFLSPAQWVAMSAQRHMHEYGTTREEYAAVALSGRKNANRNPRANFYERELTLDDYMNSRMIAEPICLFDCCLESDGACAWVVTSAERARGLKQTPAYIMAAAQGSTSPQHVMNSLYGTAEGVTTGLESVLCAKELFGTAGIEPKDVDVVQIYDHFIPWVVMALEDYGFCKKGEGGPFVASGAIEYGKGHLPMNTSGGHLSEAYIHGHNHILEGVRQIRGTSTSQVENVEISMVTSAQGGPTSAILLRK
jgi:acetyl-CoA acetyltransferase